MCKVGAPGSRRCKRGEYLLPGCRRCDADRSMQRLQTIFLPTPFIMLCGLLARGDLVRHIASDQVEGPNLSVVTVQKVIQSADRFRHCRAYEQAPSQTKDLSIGGLLGKR